MEVPETYQEPLARIVIDRFRRAKQHRATAKLGCTTVEQTLYRSWRQVEGECDPCLAEAVEESGVDLNINLTLLKIDAWTAWGRSVFADQPDMPWIVKPTTLPDLSEAGRAEAIAKMRMQLFGPNAQPATDLNEMARIVKRETMAAEQKYANDAARNMERLMRDQCEEADFRDVLMAVLRDMGTYPYAVMRGPLPRVKRTLEWVGNKLVPKYRMVMGADRISPFDFFWSDDSPNSQDGSYICIRERMTPYQLMQAAQLKSYISTSVLAALQHFQKGSVSRDWLNPNPEIATGIMWQQTEQIDIVTMYGLFSGRELKPYGLQVDDNEYYEAIVKTLGPYCIQVLVNRNPNPFKRPIHTASMSNNGEKIPGIGIAQKLRDIERAYHSVLRALVRNTHFSSGPIGEVDFSRIQNWIDEADLGHIDPYEITPVDPDMAGSSNGTAYNFHNIQNNSASLINVMQYFEHLADRHSQIPAAFHGEAQGSGVNRTYRGVTLLQGNALKGIQFDLMAAGEGIVRPFAANLDVYNKLYSNDPTVKGDSQVHIRDIGGLLAREIKKQSTLETLQLVAQIAQTNALPKGALAWAANEALEAAGVDTERFAARERLAGATEGQTGVDAEAAAQPQEAIDATLGGE